MTTKMTEVPASYHSYQIVKYASNKSISDFFKKIKD